MSAAYDCEVIERPGQNLTTEEQQQLHASLRALGGLCFDPVPNYQVFATDTSHAFEDKILVTARQNDALIGFVSVVILDEPKLEHPVIHSGLTCIHPRHRRSRGVLQQLFGNLYLYLLTTHPKGVWMTTVTDIVSSLVQMSMYTIDNFPSPILPTLPTRDAPSNNNLIFELPAPSAIHLEIARTFSARHRAKALIAPAAHFSEADFVFRGSNDHAAAAAFRKDVDAPDHWHRDHEASAFFRGLLRPGTGDEVLLVGFLDPGFLKGLATSERLGDGWRDRYSKL
ncbi:Uu.00g013300.m01.CDS01 [Anthostomella pinea]|uniref:Uu.00g013300.m01.CDS01 n=1 Tax=Anthostomella pinea TaxID=933095 RepID=A0AAI8VSC3_9PEZI|nr:Uu.00g013300.m01.CDS01 [Anthostomella pinea]